MKPNQIRDLIYGLPDRDYLEFIDRNIGPGTGALEVDPFAIDLPDEQFDDTYFSRRRVDGRVTSPGYRMILGRPGSGKSSLFVANIRRIRSSVLAVGLNLNHLNTVEQGEGSDSPTSILTPELLCEHVFHTYWRRTILAPERRSVTLPVLRQERTWMELVRWFYNKYTPALSDIEDEFEFVAWLKSPSLDPKWIPGVSSFRMLDELIRLITYQPTTSSYGQESTWRTYQRVEVLVDGAARLPALSIPRLLQDVQRLYDMHLDHLGLKVFLRENWRAQVLDMGCVRQGRASVYELPEWEAGELRDLLRRRLSLLQGGTEDRGLSGYLASFLASPLHVSLENMIIENAHGSPLHALRLARGATALCALKETEGSVSESDVQGLIDKYKSYEAGTFT